MPLFAEPCAAVFSSPAADYVEKELDLNELCIRRRASTFFVQASGDVMVVEGEFTVKRLHLQSRIALLPMNPAYPVIYPEELQLLGVVT